MARTEKRLFGPALLSDSTATKYTCPADTRAKVRYLHVSNNGAATTLTLSIGSDAAGTRLFDAYPIGANEVKIFFVDWTLVAAEIIAAHAADANRLNVTLGGWEESTV